MLDPRVHMIFLYSSALRQSLPADYQQLVTKPFGPFARRLKRFEAILIARGANVDSAARAQPYTPPRQTLDWLGQIFLGAVKG